MASTVMTEGMETGLLTKAEEFRGGRVLWDRVRRESFTEELGH